MKILSTQYNINNKALEIYTAGCNGNPKCEDCHNPESWDFTLGEEYNNDYFEKIKANVNEFPSLIDNIMILGGEPLDNQIHDIREFLIDLKTLDKDIWLFTRYQLCIIPKMILELCDYVKCGSYKKDLKTDNNIWFGVQLASSNQVIYKKGLDYKVPW
jgi:anaerobic ribonucleoside-triphosphate reductase activating protein